MSKIYDLHFDCGVKLTFEINQPHAKFQYIIMCTNYCVVSYMVFGSPFYLTVKPTQTFWRSSRQLFFLKAFESYLKGKPLTNRVPHLFMAVNPFRECSAEEKDTPKYLHKNTHSSVCIQVIDRPVTLPGGSEDLRAHFLLSLNRKNGSVVGQLISAR